MLRFLWSVVAYQSSRSSGLSVSGCVWSPFIPIRGWPAMQSLIYPISLSSAHTDSDENSCKSGIDSSQSSPALDVFLNFLHIGHQMRGHTMTRYMNQGYAAIEDHTRRCDILYQVKSPAVIGPVEGLPSQPDDHNPMDNPGLDQNSRSYIRDCTDHSHINYCFFRPKSPDR